MLDIGDAPSRYELAVTTKQIAGIVEYNPGDLTIVVRAGTTLAEVESELARHNQCFSLQAPYPDRSTVGGALATNSYGPLRLAYGSARDAVIGTRVALPNGEIARSGGRVVKNVAGYDLSKLFIGSFGTLGLIVEAAFKVFPRPQVSRVVLVPAHDLSTALRFAESLAGFGPGLLSLAVMNSQFAREEGLEGSTTVAIVGGTVRATDEYAARVKSHAGSLLARSLNDSEGNRLMRTLQDFPGRATVRLSARSVLPHQSSATAEDVEALIYPTIGSSYVFAPRWHAEHIAQVRRDLARAGGYLVVWHGTPDLYGVSSWGEPGHDVSLMRAVKSTFDPERIMSPGRFVGGI